MTARDRVRMTAIASMLLLGMTAAHGGDGKWNGTASGSAPTFGQLWSDSGKWVGGNIAGTVGTTTSPDTLDHTVQAGHYTIELDANYNVRSIVSSPASHGHAIATQNGSVLSLSGGGSITGVGGGEDKYFAPIRLEGGSGGGYSLLGERISIYCPLVGTAATGGDYELVLGGSALNSQVATSGAYVGSLGDGTGGGTLSVVKEGTGRWTLANASTYTGTTTVRNGRLKFSHVSSFGVGTSAIVLGDNGTPSDATVDLEQANNITFTRNIVVNAVNPSGESIISVRNNLGSAEMSGVITLNRTLRFHNENTGSLTVSGQVTGQGGVVKTGPDRLTLSGSFNDYQGGTVVNGGVLAATGAGAMGSGGVVVNNATLRANDGVGLSTAINLQLTNGVWESGAAIGRALGAGANQVRLAGSSGFSAYNAAANVNLGGSGATLVWDSTPGFEVSSLVLNAATANNTLTFQNGLDLNGADRTISANANTAVISGAIGNSSGTAGIVKVGTGILSLKGVNTFNGGMTVNAGTLTIDYAGQNTGAVLVPATAALTLNGGTVSVSGSAVAGQTTSQTLAGLTVATGGNTVVAVANSSRPVVLNLGAITRPTGGGFVNFTLPAGTQDASNGITTSTGGSSGRIGTWATVNGSDWAAKSGDNIVAYASAGAYVDVTRLSSGAKTIASSSASMVRIIEGTGTAGDITPAAAGTTDIATLLQTATGGTTTYNPGTTDILRLGAEGGILMANNASALNVGAAAGDGKLTAGGADNTAGTIALVNHHASNVLSVNAIVEDNGSGAVGIEKGGAGAVTLGGANTFSGGVTLSAGTLTVSQVNGLGPGRLTVNGGQLTMSAANQTVASLAGTGGTINYSGRTLTAGGDNSSTTFTGIFSGNGGLNKVGSGVLTLWDESASMTASSFSGGGGLVVSAGTLRLGASHRIQTSTSPSVKSGATFDLNGYNQALSAFSLEGGSTVTTGAGTVTLSTATRPFGGISGGAGTVALIAGNVYFSATTRIDLDVRKNAANAGITQVFDGVVGGASAGIGLTGNQEATAVVRFQGAGDNTFTGPVFWSKSALELAKPAGVTAVSGDLAVSGGTVTWLADEQVADTATVTMSSTGKLNLNGKSDWVRNLYFGAVMQAEGTWGGTGSGAQNINTTYFIAGTGVLRVGAKPEPGTVVLVR